MSFIFGIVCGVIGTVICTVLGYWMFIKGIQGHVVCTYCGTDTTYSHFDKKSKEIAYSHMIDHDRTCLKNPIVREVIQVRKQRDDAIDLCNTLHAQLEAAEKKNVGSNNL